MTLDELRNDIIWLTEYAEYRNTEEVLEYLDKLIKLARAAKQYEVIPSPSNENALFLAVEEVFGNDN